MITTSNVGGLVRSCHPYAYRSGEWARVVAEDSDVHGRACWLVAFDDGATDLWVIEDPVAAYEFSGAFDVDHSKET